MTTPNPATSPASVLTVMAHPDDAELWAGGTLARLAQVGASVTIAVPEHADAIRNTEAATAADELGARYHSYPAVNANALHDLLDATRPEVVITHPLDDVHPDHRHVAHTLTAALPEVVIATGRPRRVYTSDTYNGLTSHSPIAAHSVIDVTETWETKMRALAAHASQPITEHFGPMAETLGRLWGSRIGTRYGENFVPLPVLGRVPAATTL
ncbi:PIG-L deacetylase family protein [Saccharomonospora sp. CUA-673]|uniref:PIG-L deacetylase family protein n=1 Tax=Saccharomonospora sp. CUA-673 TaxID=1904969 RepID=UPI002100CC98|nr:PIG-L family deacetylase [Saccharomonospora sp. CUA-673]